MPRRRPAIAALAAALILVGSGCGAGAAGQGGSGADVERTATSIACDGKVTTTIYTDIAAGPGTSTATAGGRVTGTVGGPLGPTPTTTPAPAVISADPVHLSDGDNGSSILVHTAAHLVIDLGPGAAPFCWSRPRISDDRVLAEEASASGNDRAAHGRFTARVLGAATVNATLDPYCSPACGAASQLWKVTVQVVP